MRIAISATGNDLSKPLSPVFGRCEGFIIIETQEGKIAKHSFIANTAAQAGMGAGIAAAQLIIEQKVDAVIASSVGPNAFTALSQNKIKVFQARNASIEKAVEMLEKGELEEISGASRPGHYGLGRRGMR